MHRGRGAGHLSSNAHGAHSHHQYVEFVWDQSSATWLGCHRRDFEWFDGVPERVIIDNAKCAIVRACSRDPLVQRAYAECAEGTRPRFAPTQAVVRELKTPVA